jgi:ATP-binding cassette subfamily F protein uup
MEKLTDEIAKLEILLSDPDLFTSQPAKFQKASDALVARQTALQDAEEEWLTLEEKADS